MIGILDCKNHQSPINIIVSENDVFVAYCQTCFQIITKKNPQSQAVRLNTHTLDIFDAFTNYVYEQLASWTQQISNYYPEAIFQEVNLHEYGYQIRNNHQISKRFAIQIIQDYRQLIKSNRDSVLALRSPQIFYHHQFLKDIYNLVMKNWRISANLIANNYSEKLTSIDHKQREFKIKASFIDEIEKQRSRMVSQKLQFVIVKTHPLLSEMNRVNQAREGGLENISLEDQMNGLQDYQSPVLIKKIESFQEIKPYFGSGKIIEDKPEQAVYNRVKNMKKSKIIEQKDYYQANLKYGVLLQELESVKLQNDALRSQNNVLKSQSKLFQQQNRLLRKKCEEYESELKRHRQGDKSNRFSLTSYQLNDKGQQKKELQNCRHDIRILVQYVKKLQNSQVFDKTQLKSTLSQLKSNNYFL